MSVICHPARSILLSASKAACKEIFPKFFFFSVPVCDSYSGSGCPLQPQDCGRIGQDIVVRTILAGNWSWSVRGDIQVCRPSPSPTEKEPSGSGGCSLPGAATIPQHPGRPGTDSKCWLNEWLLRWEERLVRRQGWDKDGIEAGIKRRAGAVQTSLLMRFFTAPLLWV